MSPISVGTSRSLPPKKTDAPKLWLLLVGVKEYIDEQLTSLRYSAGDCQGLAEALTSATEQFTQREVYIYHDFASRRPTKENVSKSIQEITQKAKSQDTILFYFSGHGILEPSTHQAVLCLRDTQKSNLLNTGLVLQELLQLLGNSAAENKLVWLDACHSGGMTLKGTPTEPLLNPTSQLVEVLQQRAAKSKGFYALLSCDINQLSWEFPELGHGVFTYYLMRGLEGEAASHGVISADGLYRYIYHQTLQYIDKTNQQLRLINQQKRSKGETQLFEEYPLQTPKRIVEGVGEMIIGTRPEKADVALHNRLGVVIEGLTGSATLEISKLFSSTGAFELEYLQATKVSSEDIKSTLVRYLQAEAETVLLYLRGYIEETEASDCFLLGNTRIKRSWLKQQLRNCAAKQIIILDCPVSKTQHSAYLQEWIEDLQIELHTGQCLIGCTSAVEEPERFIQTLLGILKASSFPDGLSAAGAISKLQVSLAGANISLSVWLSATRGIIEIIPANNDNTRQKASQGLDIGVCPYMGLSAFYEDDFQYFYGRESLTQQLVYSLVNSSFLAVVGASGSGKSSLVQAGLIPQLRLGKQIPSSQQWLIKTMRPSDSPIQTLAQKLGDDNHLVLEGLLHQGVEGFVYWIRSLPYPMTVLVIDQFEELFTLAPSVDREKFLELLQATEYAKDRFKLVITLRADFIATCLEVPLLAKVLQESSILVPPKLTLDDYRRVISNPAQQVGLKLEPELVEVLLHELDNSVGDLPILSFVLEQLWQHRSDGQLTLRAYQQQLGGIQGALERSCQAVYESLDAQAKECAKWIFLSLTQLGEGTEDTRRRVFKSDLLVKKYSTELIDRTLGVLTGAKLVVINLDEVEELGVGKGVATDTTDVTDVGLAPVTIEVAHEILIRHWSTLRWWLEENRERLRKQRQIEHAAQMWLQGNKQDDFLLHGVRLAEAEDIYIKYTDELSNEVQRYVEACLVERKRQEFQQRKRLRQAQRAVVALSVLGIAACSFGGLAYWQGREAQLREINALNESSRANLLSHQQLEAVIASVKAGKQLENTFNAPPDIKFKTINTLEKALKNAQELNRLEGHEVGVFGVSVSRDGIIASASGDGTVRLWKSDGKLIKILKGHQALVKSVSFSPDGKFLASASFDKTVKLWSREGSLIKTLNGHTTEVLNVTWSHDSQIIATAGADKTVKIWKLDGTLVRTINAHSDFVNSLSFHPQGNLLASASRDKTVKIWNIKDGTLVANFSGHQAEIFSVAFSPDGQKLASGGGDRTVKLWNSNGKLITTITAHGAQVNSVSFSSDGRTLASTSNDSSIKLWNVQDGTLIETLLGHTVGVYSASFSPDNQTLVSASVDKTVRVWQRDNSLYKTLVGHQGKVYSVNFSPDGKTLASASEDTTIKLWRLPGTLHHTIQGYSKWDFGHSSPVYSLSFSADGQILASASGDYYIKLWQTRDNDLIKTLQGHDSEVNHINFSPDGETIASASADKTIKLWRIKPVPSLINTLKGHDDEILSVSFSPNGQLLASTSRDKTIKIWDVKDAKLLKTIPAHTNSVNSVSFSPDGKMLASASLDKTIKLWRTRDYSLIKTLEGHSDSVLSVTFSPDGNIIASASSDRTVKLWNRDGIDIKTLRGHNDTVINVSFSPDAEFLASASFDGTAKIWRLDSEKLQTLDLNNLLVRSCALLNDYLKTNPSIQQEQHLCS